MCRIFGEFSFSSNLSDFQVFSNLNVLSKSGGPDSTGIWEDQHVRFGFNRLAILDTSSRGNQPIVSPSGRYVIMMNGEIYNFIDLKTKYAISEGELRSSSDSEVIAHLVDRLPISDVARVLDGMFAVSVWDCLSKTLFLMRDFAGIKPLFYSVIPHVGCVFASQFDQLFKHPWISKSKSINLSGVADYIRAGYMHAPETVFNEIKQLLPGELLAIRPDSCSSECFFQCFSDTLPSIQEGSAYAASELKRVFNSSVKRQLVSDVPLAAFLSGGIDSPLITASASLQSNDLESFTIGVDDPRFNEADIAQAYARYLHVKNRTEFINEHYFLNVIDEHFKAFPEPFGDYSSLPTYVICKLAAQKYRVMLSGDGGDELFWGYPRFLTSINHLHWFSYPQVVRNVLPGLMKRLGRRISYGILSKDFSTWVMEQHSHNKNNIAKSILPGGFVSEGFKGVYSLQYRDKRGALLALRRNEFHAHLQRLLIKVDRASMANSLEVRVPFLSKEMIEFCELLDPGLVHSLPKFLLRQLMHDFYPDRLINVKKMGFTIPIDTWMKGVLKEEIEDLILSPNAWGSEFFDRRALTDYTKGYFSGVHSNDWGIWILYALQKWKQFFIE